MNAPQRHLPKKHVVRLIFNGHEHDEDPVKELEAFEGRDAHVEEDTKEDRHRDVAEDGCQKNRHPNHEEY